MRILKHLFENNERWSKRMEMQDQDFFKKLSQTQDPDYLWIGCSDSRVPANEIVDLSPGELFVHRNVANLLVHTDLNALSVLQYAVEVLKVKHIIVCGHYGCGGVAAAMSDRQHGLIDNWLRHIKDVYTKHQDMLDAIEDQSQRCDQLCRLNVIEQVQNVCHTTIVQNAWKSGASLAVHGWVYRLEDGLIRDLDICVQRPEEISPIYRVALSSARAGQEITIKNTRT